MSIKVAIDSGPLTSGHSVRGVGAYTRELIRSINEVKNKYIKIESLDFLKSDLSQFDVVHYPYFHPHLKTLPDKFNPHQKVVVTIHDLIQLIYPDVYQPGLKGKLIFFHQRKMINKADAIIVPTETSKKDVVRYLGVEQNKVRVISEGVREVFRRITDEKFLAKISNKYKLPKKFILYVGDVNYNKNIPTLIKSCVELNVPLVICGKQALEVADAGINLMNLEGPRDYLRFLFNIPHPELKHYFELSESFDQNKNLIYRLGFVSDEDLAAIFNLASVYVQASYYEGFGLPVLEAFASRTPVVISKTNCLVEVAADAAIQSDVHNSEDFIKNIGKCLTDRRLREVMVNKGIERLKEFSWKKAAGETMEVYGKVVGIKN